MVITKPVSKDLLYCNRASVFKSKIPPPPPEALVYPLTGCQGKFDYLYL